MKCKKTDVQFYIDTRLAEIDSYQKTFERLFYFLEDDELFFIPEGEQWAAIEVIEHLNFFAELYLPQWTSLCKMEGSISQTPTLKIGWSARKLRQWMEGDPDPSNKWNTAPKQSLPRRLRDENLRINAQKMLENFISDLDQLRRIVKIIPHSPKLRRSRVHMAVKAIRIPALSALELYIPHIGRHMKQAERILNGGRLYREEIANNPDLINPTKPE
ncbi:MAG: hypothetical protein RL754_62 [Bacteroidota bacterium]